MDLRASILLTIKQQRSASITELAARFGVTFEAIRQHLLQLEDEGIVTRRVVRAAQHDASAGRPPATYALTDRGEHHFPKLYDVLASSLVALIERDEALANRVLGAYTDARVDELRPRVQGRMIERRVEALRDFYASGDAFMSSGSDERGLWLEERNCPYYSTAMEHPAICSTSVTALSRLVGYQVVRDERFQSGDHRCVFRVDLERPVSESARGYEREPAA